MHRPGGGNSLPCYMTGTRAVRSRKRGRGEWCGRKGVLSGRREAAFSARRFLRAWSIKPQGFNAITDSLSGHLGVAAQATTQQLNVKKPISSHGTLKEFSSPESSSPLSSGIIHQVFWICYITSLVANLCL